MSSLPRIIYITGIDGSGKTTATEVIKKELEEQGHDVKIMWLRFNHFFSKPLLGFCRLIGLTKYETVNGIRVGYHEFHRSKSISWLFVFFQYLDAVRVKYFKILPALMKKNRVLVLDRYVYDILIDISVDTGKDYLNSRTGKLFKHLLPNDCLKILLMRNYDDVIDARPEGEVDRFFRDRYDYFCLLSESEVLVSIDNDKGINEFVDVIKDQVSCE